MPDVTLDLGNQYIGSAYSPQVAITETEDGHEVTFTFADSENPGQLTTASYDVPTYADEEAAREAAEAARAAAESARAAAESSREAYEQQRKDNELDRVFNENARANAEELRVDAEQARAAAETARASAESSRASAEQARTSAETARASAEAGRATAESARVSAEQARATAENARASAEAARESAEATRQTNTTAAIARTDAATSAANTATTNADAATTAAQAATGEAETATDAANAAAALATAAAETITDAYFPNLTAGAAEGITGGGPTDTAAWTERTCPGTDGPATIESIHGRTLVWNQLYRKNPDSGTVRGVAYVVDTDGLITLNGTATETGYILGYVIAGKAGHKYLLHGHGGNFDASKAVFSLQVSGSADMSNGGVIVALSADANIAPAARLMTVGAVLEDVTFRPQLFDLTAMFGAGNEPSTVAEFEALYPEPYYPYDAGSLLSVQMTGIETTDADSNVLMSRTIPATDLRSAGTVYDEQTATERITRVGTGTVQSVGAVSTGDNVKYVVLNGTGADSYPSSGAFPASAKTVVTDLLGPTDGTDGTTRLSVARTWTGIYAYAPLDSDDSIFDQLVGAEITYALATPTATPIDPPLNLTYRAAAGGTERVTHTDPTAAPTLVVTYGSTADGIRDRALACIAPVENGKASANYGIGSYLVHGGTLCRVTTAIAAGEAIAIGTNVTATTVMAELLTLTQ